MYMGEGIRMLGHIGRLNQAAVKPGFLFVKKLDFVVFLLGM